MKRNYTAIAPISIFAESKSEIAQVILQEQKELKFNSSEEMIYHLTHKVHNIKHVNGRIYMKIDKSGKLFANSVSPYAEDFLNNVEEKIQPLVKALNEKRYLTYSSCEGHGLSFRRYVGLAFADEESREYVEKMITFFKIKGVFTKSMNSVANQKITRDIKGNPIFFDKYTLEQKQELATLKQEEANTFNIQFHRNYEEYFFLEIIILEEIDFSLKYFFKLPRNLWLWYMKKYRWEKITKNLVEKINNSNFKKYLY